MHRSQRRQSSRAREHASQLKKALEIGVDAVELDVRKTNDNQLVVIHDSYFKKTTNGKGLVSELTLKEIKELSTEKGEKILPSIALFRASDC